MLHKRHLQISEKNGGSQEILSQTSIQTGFLAAKSRLRM